LLLEARDNPRMQALERFARDQGVTSIEKLPRNQMDRLAGGAEHQGLICWAPALELLPIESLLRDEQLIALALDEIQDPQNFGAIIRCAVGIANAAVIWGEHASAPLTPATFRASAGAIEQARLCRVRSLRDALNQCREAGMRVIGLEAKAPEPLHAQQLTGPTVLVLGSEHHGLARAVRAACTGFGRLLLSGRLDSLNVSVAAGIALHTAQISRLNSKS
jgi:23S rRNA (guanosine2251-2'-O)-methyltransferase